MRMRRAMSLNTMLKISIHTPLAGSDAFLSGIDLAFREFQSTLPLRGATQGRDAAGPVRPISIHTPLAGSDAGIGRVRP